MPAAKGRAKMKTIGEWIRHNQGMVLSIIVIAGVAAWTFGCQSRVTSMVDPSKMVNAQELELEIELETVRLNLAVENLLGQAEIKMADLARQDAIKQKLFDFAAITVDAGTVNPAGVVGLLFSILGVGAVIDNRIKDKVIKNRPLKVT